MTLRGSLKKLPLFFAFIFFLCICIFLNRNIPNMFNLYKSARKPASTCILILFLTIVFSFPLLILLPSDTLSLQSLICIFSIDAICTLSISLLILKKETLSYLFHFHPVPAIALTTVFAIEMLHFMLITSYSSRDFAFSITLFVVPLAIYAYGAETKKSIIYFLSLFWLINTCHCLLQIINNANCTGITGNQNWNASLILATSPFIIYFISKRLSEKYTSTSINLFLSSIPGFISLYFIYLCDSRGAWLSLVALCFIVFIIYLPGLKRRLLLRITLYSILLLVLFTLFEGRIFAGFIFKDVRFSLWHSTLRLFMDNPLLGVSCPSFESAYAQYRPIDYFIKSHYFAFRTTHPHNEFLYILACFGIFGAISWIILWIYPLVKLFKIFKKLDSIIKLSLLSLTILVIHSMFDLILFQWPTIFIACILLGLLWQECWPIGKGLNRLRRESYGLLTFPCQFIWQEREIGRLNECPLASQSLPPAGQARRGANKYNFLYNKFTTGILPVDLNTISYKSNPSISKIDYIQKFLILASFILSFSVFTLFSYQDFMYSANIRNSKIAFYYSKEPAKSLVYLNDAIDYIPVPPSISHCGIVSSTIFKDNIMSLFYFDKLLNTPCPQIAHSNRHIAESLLKSGRKKEALDFLRKDTGNFPISVVSLYMEMSLEDELGQKQEAEITAEKLFNALRHMGLTEKHIPAILKNPYYENKFVELRNMSK